MLRLTTSLLSTSLLLAACADAGGPPPAIRFADASEAQRHAAITSALGYPLLLGELTVRSMSAQTEDSLACLARIELVDALLLDAGVGCSTLAGVHYTGRVYVVHDPAWASRLHFDGLRVDAGGRHLGFSGEVARGVPDAGGVSRTIERLSFDLGVPVELSITGSCYADGLCVADADASAEIDGAGRFDIEFARRLTDGQWGGFIELYGEDVLRLDLSAPRDASGCWTYTIDGQPAGSWCSAAPPQ